MKAQKVASVKQEIAYSGQSGSTGPTVGMEVHRKHQTKIRKFRLDFERPGRLLMRHRGYRVYLFKSANPLFSGWCMDSKVIGLSPDVLNLPPEAQMGIVDKEIIEREYLLYQLDWRFG